MRSRLVGGLAVLALWAGACGGSSDAVVTAPAATTPASSVASPVTSTPSVAASSGSVSATADPVLPIPKVTSWIIAAVSCRSSQLPDTGTGVRYVLAGDVVYYTGRAEPCDTGRLPSEQPQVRSLDLQTGNIDVVADWAYAPAVAPDGRLAYAQGPPEKFGIDNYHSWYSTVMVETDGVAEAWTDPTQTQGRYQPLAWAGDTLLAAFEYADTGYLDLSALRGPGEETRWTAILHAVSPDRSKFLVNEDPRKSGLVVYSADTLEPVASLSYADYLAVMAPGLDPADSVTPDGYFSPPEGGSLSTHFGDIWLPDGTIIMNADTGIAVLRYIDGPTPRIEPVKYIPLDPEATTGSYSLANFLAITTNGQVAVTGASILVPGPPPSLPAKATPDEITKLLAANAPTEGPSGFICDIDTGTCTKGKVGNAFEQPEWGLR